MLLLILIFILTLLIINPNISSACIIETASLWFTNLVPILYPTFIVLDFLSNNKNLDLICTHFFGFFKKIFKINYPKSAVIIILSLICGAPSSTKLVLNALENEEIDKTEAQNLIYCWSWFSISYSIFILNKLNCNTILYIILIFFASLLTFRFLNKPTNTNLIIKKQPKNFIDIFSSSFKKNIDILLTILGIMMFFNIILAMAEISPYIYSYFEVLNGHSLLNNLQINKKLKDILLISSLSFLGISTHLQIISVYQNINYIKFLIVKIVQALFVSLFFITFVILF